METNNKYTPTTEELRYQYLATYSVFGDRAVQTQADEFDRWLSDVERAAAEKGYWEACLRIANGENNLDIAHVYQKQNPYLEEVSNE